MELRNTLIEADCYRSTALFGAIFYMQVELNEAFAGNTAFSAGFITRDLVFCLDFWPLPLFTAYIWEI